MRGRYEFIAPIGQGGMSVVYKARHVLIGNLVAIKLLQGKLAHDQNSFKRFQLEAQAVSRLDHPNLIKIRDFGLLDGGYPFLVMDYVEGQTLAEVLKEQGPMPPKRAIPLFKALCDGLFHAHSRGILHRDLKPSNVLITADPNGDRVQIIDFGIAKVLTCEGEAGANLTTTGEIFGSPFYMSPEQCMGQEVDVRSDIYSMGCLMYETLTGSTPHGGSNVFDTIQKQVNEVTEPITKLIPSPQAEQLSHLVLKSLEKQRDERHQSFAELLADLNAVESGTKLKIRRNRSNAKPFALGTRVLLATVLAIFAYTAYDICIKELRYALIAEKLKRTGEISVSFGGLSDADVTRIANYQGTKSMLIGGNFAVTREPFYKLANHPSLKALYVDGIGVDDTLVPVLATVPNLEDLSIGNTKITSASFKDFGKLTKLERLLLPDMNLTDADIAKFPVMPNLRKLKLDCNPLLTSQAISICANRFPNLNYLTFRDTAIGDEAVPILLSIPNLKETRSLRTRLTKDGIAKLEAAHITVLTRAAPIPGTRTFERDTKEQAALQAAGKN